MIYDVIIVGAGPAGVSAALYATSRGLNTLIIEQCENAGGTLKKVSNITHYTGFKTGESGENFSKMLDYQILKCGANFVNDTVVSTDLTEEIKTVMCKNGSYGAKAVIIAAGTTQNTPEVKVDDIVYRKHFHNHASKDGKSYDNIIVIGGSDGAAKEALYLSKIANHVDLVVIEDDLVAVPEFSNPIKQSKDITLHVHSVVSEVKGDSNIESVIIRDIKTDKETIISKENMGLFYYMGSKPNSEIFEGIDTENGYIITDNNMKTNISGVYAIGDIIVKQIRQISTSVSDGAIAAIEVKKYLSE
ncbi:MAG: NAD(P)/FAD-dependent oxidoreductase [Tissierellia bacterium]|nr:NAD(P)/FAD-dependent oxidoreductase [Tissierellia bacterium]